MQQALSTCKNRKIFDTNGFFTAFFFDGMIYFNFSAVFFPYFDECVSSHAYFCPQCYKKMEGVSFLTHPPCHASLCTGGNIFSL